MNLDSTLNLYLQAGIKGEQLVVDFPMWGNVWERRRREETFYPIKPMPYLTMNDIVRQKGQKRPGIYEKGDSTFVYFEDNLDSVYRRFYYDDEVTLFNKMNWAKSTRFNWALGDSTTIKGVGLNSLGYMATSKPRRDSIWRCIAHHFGRKQSAMGWIVASYLITFIPIGMVFSLVHYWEVRNALAKFNRYRNRYWLALLVATLIALICADIIPRDSVGVFLGAIVLAIFGLYIFVRRMFTRMRRYTRYAK